MNDDSNAAKESQRGQRAEKAVPGNGRKKSGVLEDPVQRAIGEKLRAVFDEVVQQPVPERFAELLRKLAEQEQKNK